MINKLTQTKPDRSLARLRSHWLILAGVALTALSTLAASRALAEATRYQPTYLVSDLPEVAQLQDTNLVNSWGIAHGPGPFWIGDNGTHKATLYAVTNDAAGAPHVTRNNLVVTIPGSVTGLIFNNTTAFNTNAFVFVSEEGTIAGWRGALGTAAEALAARPGAVYKGVTLATNETGPVLLTANFREGTIDLYNSSTRLAAQFADPTAPEGYAPFNVQNLAGHIFVTFAKQDDEKRDDAAGPGRGLIDIFDPTTGVFHRFAAGRAAGGKVRQMNSPWGLALAPTTFGAHADQLLVGNFGSGTIMAFEADGKFKGLLKTTERQALVVPGLWALTFGSSGASGVATDLYFTAGPGDEEHGLFGVIQKVTRSGRDQ